MEGLIKQMRVRFSGVGQENKEETGNVKDQRIPPQRTQSFKGDKKKGQNWLRLHFSRQTSYDSSNGEYQAAVAATAFAIKSLEESSNIPEKRKRGKSDDTSLTKIKSKTGDTNQVSIPRTISTKTSDGGSMTNMEVPEKRVRINEATSEKMPEKVVAPAPSIKKTPTFAEPQGAVPETAVAGTPSIKKTPSFAEKLLDSTGSTRPESLVPKPDLPPTRQPSFPPTEIKRQSSTKPGIGETKAYAWERAEMAKIEERYKILSTTILNWENKKAAKAKRRLERRENELAKERAKALEHFHSEMKRIKENKAAKAKRRVERRESELDKKRAKALRHFNSEMKRIKQIAGGARAQADEYRRNEELKVKEKANKIRSTGKLPATCFCF